MTTIEPTPFIYLLNAFEAASQSAEPAKERTAVLEYVRAAEKALQAAQARCVELTRERDFSDRNWESLVERAEAAESSAARLKEFKRKYHEAMDILSAYDKIDRAEAIGRMQQAEARCEELTRERDEWKREHENLVEVRRRDLERITKGLDDYREEARKQQVRLAEQVESLRADAERYRWLRSLPMRDGYALVSLSIMDINEDGPTGTYYDYDGADLDHAIDAARSEGAKE